jgi:hypothetical protein
MSLRASSDRIAARMTLENRNSLWRARLSVAGCLLALALIPIVLLGPNSGPRGGAPSGSPVSVSLGTSPSPAEPSASLDVAAVERQIADIEADVVGIRKLRALRPVQNRLVSTDEFIAEIRAEFAKANPGPRLHAEEALYERLGLLPSGSDLASLALDQLGQGVAGYYRPDRKDLTVIKRSGGFGPLERQVLSHEYTHALQDQHFDLEALGVGDPTNGDRALARLALVEGDASLVMAKWAEQRLTTEELTEVIRQTNLRDAERLGSGLPPLLLRQAAFPYFDGLLFVTALHASGDWAAVDAAFRRPPDSTEQILHLDKYLAHEQPSPVPVPHLAESLGPAWREAMTDTLGEVNIQVWAALANGPTASRRAAAGWGGDRVASYEGPDGRWGVAWESRWDTATDASEFAAAARLVVAGLGGSTDVREGFRDTNVMVFVASDSTTLSRLSYESTFIP